jgi:hypothetical protein
MVHCESREAYDALTTEDGWREEFAYLPNGTCHHWKKGEIRGFTIIAHAPHER